MTDLVGPAHRRDRACIKPDCRPSAAASELRIQLCALCLFASAALFYFKSKIKNRKSKMILSARRLAGTDAHRARKFDPAGFLARRRTHEPSTI